MVKREAGRRLMLKSSTSGDVGPAVANGWRRGDRRVAASFEEKE
jgi:hypothetical protein